MRSTRLLSHALLAAACCCAANLFSMAATAAEPSTAVADLATPEMLNNGRIGAAPDQLQRALGEADQHTSWKPAVNDEVARGSSTGAVYAKVAPATVVVRTRNGHGTGFVVDKAGWIVTNHHVIADADVDLKLGCRVALIHFGRLEEGIMVVEEAGQRAFVHAASEAQDLALLKLVQPPARTLPVVALAAAGPKPGNECVVLGHPRAGMLWTVRSGEIAGLGTWPRDMINVVMTRLSVDGADREQLSRQLAAMPSRRIVISSCGINPGDSGGPLLNSAGELVAVTYAIPKGDAGEGISVDKFSYHVHLDEVKTLLGDKPARQELFVPSVWPEALINALVDRDGDGRGDTLIFGLDRKSRPTGMLFDLDQDTSEDFDLQKINDPAVRDKWNYEFALQPSPTVRTFYDTDNDGQIDVILTDAQDDNSAELVLERTAGDWRVVPINADSKPKMLDPLRFQKKELQQRFAALVFAKPKPKPADPASSDLPKVEKK